MCRCLYPTLFYLTDNLQVDKQYQANLYVDDLPVMFPVGPKVKGAEEDQAPRIFVHQK